MGRSFEELKNDLADAVDLREARFDRIRRKRNDEQAVLRDLREVNKRLKRNRELRKELREEDRDAKAEDIVDRIEDLEDVKDDLLLDLDAKKDRTDEAEKVLKEAQQRVRGLRKKVAARKKSREGKGDLTPHFSVDEFNCRDGTPVPQAAYGALKSWCEKIGEPVRARYGPVRVNSGYRHRAYNAAIGGASNSIHIYDLHPATVAVDHWVAGTSPATVANFEDGLAEASGLGRYATFTHSDNRHRIGWSRSRWWG